MYRLSSKRPLLGCTAKRSGKRFQIHRGRQRQHLNHSFPYKTWHWYSQCRTGPARALLAEQSDLRPGHNGEILDRAESCQAAGNKQERTAGWLHAAKQPGTVPVYCCYDEVAVSHLASEALYYEGLGWMQLLLRYGLAP